MLAALRDAQTPRGHEHAHAHALVGKAAPDALNTLRSQYEQQIREATRREERARLARDLHDAVKQQLFVIQTAAATVEARFDGDNAGARAALADVRAAAREALGEMDAMIGQLEGVPMENVALVDALRKQCEALGFRTGADVRLEIGELPPTQALPPAAHEVLFRVAQEALSTLSNVARHARAKTVHVSLGLVGHRLELAVVDDGTGFDMMTTPRGMGTRNLGARTAEAGGRIVLASTPGHGTSLRFSIPYDPHTPREFVTKAAASLGVLAMAASLGVYGVGWRPWLTVITVLAAITMTRYVVAFFRIRRLVEAPA
jgi:signal transduction histidine kinase